MTDNKTNNYKMTQAEFKGRVLQSLEDIRNDVTDLKAGMMFMNKEITVIKVDLSKKACKSDVEEVQRRISNIKIISSTLGALGGFITGIAAMLIKK